MPTDWASEPAPAAEGTSSGVKRVHTIFKTHFDLGFTDLASQVVATYFHEYIPRALQTAETLRRSSRAERFIWTTGAWLIYEYLERATGAERKRMEAAIEAGDIAWHGLPFTTHSELMDASLFRAGIGLAQALDRRFGKQTIAAKMTDVPGHTRAIVPLLAEAGIQFLHIGVNTASTMPDVPPVFLWRDPSGSEVIVMYQHSYGGPMSVAGLPAAITFAHTLDNHGPQTAEEALQAFATIEAEFPEAKVMGSTLDAFARELLTVRDRLPVVEEEIGDTWIHGVATDPGKVARFRALSRLRNEWLSRPTQAEEAKALEQFTRYLLLVPEHTWGMDTKTHLADDVNYSRVEFEAVREQANFTNFAASWREQRGYLEQAVQVLDDTEMAREALARLEALQPVPPALEGYEQVEPFGPFETAHFELGFDPNSGAINHLRRKESARQWAMTGHLLGLLRYQTFSHQDYDRFLGQYLTLRPEWAIADFSKPGLATAGCESRWWEPALSGLFCRCDEAAVRFLLELTFPEKCHYVYGAPQRVVLAVEAPQDIPMLALDLQWFDKPANRQPEAFWFSFAPRTALSSAWRLEKVGQQISPLEVVAGGSRMLHAVGSGVFYDDGENRLSIETVDAPLVAPGEPSLLNFNGQQPQLELGMHFNLYNNVWGTNFPQWDGEDARFRFVLRFS